MTINAFGGQGGYPVPVVPAAIKGDLGARPEDDEPLDATEAEVNEEAAVAERIGSADNDAAT